jgi:hypothetical protein
MAWYGQTDELVGPEMSEQAFLDAEQAGIRYDHWIFTPAGHITEGNNDEYGPAAAFLGTNTVDRNPAHVTYVVDPSTDTKADSPTDHAYWMSGLTPRTTGSSAKVDAVSEAFGVGDPPVLPVALTAGTLDGGSHGPLPYQRRTLDWGAAPAQPKADQLDLTATNLGIVTVDAPRAGLSCNPKINLKSDGPTRVLIGGCPALPLPSKHACVDRRKFTFKLHHARGARVVAVEVFVNGKRTVSRRGHDIKQVTIRRLPRRKFKVKIVATQSGGSQLISTRTYHGCTKSHPTTRGRHHRGH